MSASSQNLRFETGTKLASRNGPFRGRRKLIGTTEPSSQGSTVVGVSW